MVSPYLTYIFLGGGGGLHLSSGFPARFIIHRGSLYILDI